MQRRIRLENRPMRYSGVKWPGDLCAWFLSVAFRVLLVGMVCALVVGLGILYQEHRPQSGLEHRQLLIGDQTVHVEVATTANQIRKGLMHRHSLEPGWGMLFELGAPQLFCLWMKDTHLPLTAGFIDDAGILVQLVDLEPRDRSEHCSQLPVVAVLEMPRGWFARHGVRPGHMIDVR
jgi:uncharacterized membrane protein (UPF0127 family)